MPSTRFLIACLLIACGGQAKQTVVVEPTDAEIAMEVRPVRVLPELGAAPPPVIATVGNLDRDLRAILERVAPNHPFSMMVKLGLRAGLSGLVGAELAGAIDLSAPMVAALVPGQDRSAALLAVHLGSDAPARLRQAFGTAPMAGGHERLLGQLNSQAEFKLGQDIHCALAAGQQAVLVCADVESALLASGAALVAALSEARADAALVVRFDYKQLRDPDQLDPEVREPLEAWLAEVEQLRFDGELRYGELSLQLVPQGFDITMSSHGILGKDLMSRLVLAPPRDGEPLPPLVTGPSDALSVLAIRGVDLAPFRQELQELGDILAAMPGVSEQERAALTQLRGLPWPGGPFIVAHGHDLVASEAALAKELERRNPRTKQIEAASAGYVLIGIKAPLVDIEALVNALVALQRADGDQSAQLGKAPRSAHLPAGALRFQYTPSPSEDEDPAEKPEPIDAFLVEKDGWVWVAISGHSPVAQARLRDFLRGEAGELPPEARAALRPAGVTQATMLGSMTLASAASIALADDMAEDPNKGLTTLREALAQPELIRQVIPLRMAIETQPDGAFAGSFHVHLPTSLVAQIVRLATDEE